MNKKINLLILILTTVFLCGCSTLSYSGDDFDKTNVKALNTNESFYFSTYQKRLSDDVNIRSGITKSPLPEVLAVYFEIDNQSSKDIYINPGDVKITSASKPANILSAMEYIAVYQSAANESYASAQTMAATVNNFATIANNYQGVDRALLLREQTNAEASLKQMDTYASGIRAHTLNTTSMIKAGSKKYYYLFMQEDEYPITLEYEGLQYVFNEKRK